MNRVKEVGVVSYVNYYFLYLFVSTAYSVEASGVVCLEEVKNYHVMLLIFAAFIQYTICLGIAIYISK